MRACSSSSGGLPQASGTGEETSRILQVTSVRRRRGGSAPGIGGPARRRICGEYVVVRPQNTRETGHRRGAARRERTVKRFFRERDKCACARESGDGAIRPATSGDGKVVGGFRQVGNAATEKPWFDERSTSSESEHSPTEQRVGHARPWSACLAGCGRPMTAGARHAGRVSACGSLDSLRDNPACLRAAPKHGDASAR